MKDHRMQQEERSDRLRYVVHEVSVINPEWYIIGKVVHRLQRIQRLGGMRYQ